MEFFEKFIEIIKKINVKYTKHKYRKYLNNSTNSGGIKNVIGKDYTVRFDCVFEDRKKEVQKKVETLVRKAKNNPYRLIVYIEKHGTPVYKIKNADKMLALIDEVEGFITPKKGFKALYLNYVINKKISFNFKECFIMQNKEVDPYYAIHEFYNWYAFKSGFAGYEYEAQENFKSIIYSKNKRAKMKTLTISQLLAAKEALRRDVEALDFVIKYSGETEGAKNAFEKIKLRTAAVNL